MKCIYRLIGVDGEATEEYINDFPEDEGVEKDPEEKFKICRML